MKFKIDFAKLKEFDPKLYWGLSGFFNIDDGVHEVDLSQLKMETRARLIECLYPKEDEPEELSIDLNEADNRARLAQAEVDEAAGIARLQQYVNEQGLLPIPENAAAVKEWIDKNVRWYWSAAGVDAAVSNLRSNLKWKPKTSPNAVATTMSAEPMRRLTNGESELPLDATETQMRRASVAQLRDLSRRRGEGRKTWGVGE